MNILVTGGAGFIGSNLIHYLLASAEEEYGISIGKVVNLDLLTYAGNPENLDRVQSDTRFVQINGDIQDVDLLEKLFEQYQFGSVLHLAAESHVDRSIEGPEAFLMTNVVGTFRLLEAARKHWNSLEASKDAFRFIHVSTDEVYGSLEPTEDAFSETTSYKPNSPYSASKASSDHFARAYFHTYGLPVVTTNCSNNYGPYQFPEKLLPLMISKAARGEELPVYGDGSNIRDWLYVTDHCRGLVAALSRGKPGETYNIGGKNEQANLDVLKALLALLREAGISNASEDLIRFVKDRPGHDQRYAIDCSKSEKELDWHPKESFESGLKKTVLWYLENTQWVENIESGNYQGERLGLC